MHDHLARREARRSKEFPFLDEDSPVAGVLAEANYQEAVVLIHEDGVFVCGGIERNAFLLALRKPMNRDESNQWSGGLPSWAEEGLLLSVKSPERGWGDGGKVAQRVLSDAYKSDPSGSPPALDEHTRNEISFGALRCRIIGTLRRGSEGAVSFSPDTSSPMFDTTGWLVVKPRGAALERIINMLAPGNEEIAKGMREATTSFGRVRWSLDERDPETAQAIIRPADFLRKRTIVLGMTGQGKSNAIKLLALSILKAARSNGEKVGQLLFDPHGEYANETDNDRIGLESFSLASACGAGESITFTCSRKRASSGRQQALLADFYRMPRDAHALLKKGLSASAGKESSGWMNLFLSMEMPSWSHNAEATGTEAAILSMWWGMLFMAGFEHDPEIPLDQAAKGGEPLMRALNSIRWRNPPSWVMKYSLSNPDRQLAILKPEDCARMLRDYYFQVASAGKESGIHQKAFTQEEAEALESTFGDDAQLLCEMGMRKRVGRGILGMDVVKPYKGMHWAGSFWQIATTIRNIYKKKVQGDVPAPWVLARQFVDEGKLVIVDLSAGDESLRKIFSEALAEDFFSHRKEMNSSDDSSGISDAIIYLEEAHTLVGRKAEPDELWPKLAKEGRKMKIGMVLSTQEPSGVNHYVLANAENFLVGYLNNDRELTEIAGIGDLGEFTESAKRGMEKGYFRVWCREARAYPLPLQIRLFQDLAREMASERKS